jgi:hypothetical protein
MTSAFGLLTQRPRIAGLTNEISVKVRADESTQPMISPKRRADDTVQIYEAMAYHVSQSNPVFNRRIKTVGVWSLQKTVSAVLTTLRAVMDPMTVRLQEAYTAASDAGMPLDAVIPQA